jgi:hypothetical protein
MLSGGYATISAMPSTKRFVRRLCDIMPRPQTRDAATSRKCR